MLQVNRSKRIANCLKNNENGLMNCEIYRRNPVHRAEAAHPGDADYRLPSYGDPLPGAPPCPYGARCYRRNPTHFRQFSHPPSS